MQIFSLSAMGTFHTNHNEDDLIAIETSSQKIVVAVMDGCSMGQDSHFAATLVKKIIRKASKEIDYKAFFLKKEYDPLHYLKLIVEYIFHQLQKTQQDLHLSFDELLCTIVLGVIDTESKAAEFIVIGDGVLAINGEIFEFDQDNKPDYLAYHLGESFEQWFSTQNQRLSATAVQDVSVCTDGIFTFNKFDQKKYPLMIEEDWIKLLLLQALDNSNEKALLKCLRRIEKEFGLKPNDDISIIRVSFSE